MGQEAPRIERLDASIAAMAVTATFSQMAFATELGVPFPLLSDWGGATAEAYGVRYGVWKGHEGLAKRSLFVIDEDATIRYRWVTDDAHVEPDLELAIAVLERLAGPAPD